MSQSASTIALQVPGMTCAHCVRSVTEEVSTVPGVVDVAIDLVPNGTSTVNVTADGPLDDAAVRRAIVEAGYEAD